MRAGLPDLSKFLPALQDGATETAARVADIVRAVAPVSDSGNPDSTPGELRDTIYGEADLTPTGVTISAWSDVKQAHFVIYGRGPVDKSPGFLHFWTHGDEVFTHHSDATDPNDFASLVDAEIIEAVDEGIGRALETI